MSGKGVFSLILGSVGWLVFGLLHNGDWKKIAIGVFFAGVLELLGYLWENRKHWKMMKLQLIHPHRAIRVTTAYLYRIEYNGKYLLIKRHKKDVVGYQPVGGAYKYYKGETRDLFNKLGVIPCNLVPRDEDTVDDLRIVIQKRKNLVSYLKWLASRKNREIDPTREFNEELVASGLLPEAAFRHLTYVFIGKHEELEIPSKALPIDEFRYADIFELRLENKEQIEAINALAEKGDEVLFASSEEIRKGRTDDGRVILPHSFKILPK